MTRPTNPELVAAFRALLTEGYFETDGDGVTRRGAAARSINVTKPWRSKLWNLFNEIEERLCPLEVETRRRQKEANSEK